MFFSILASLSDDSVTITLGMVRTVTLNLLQVVGVDLPWLGIRVKGLSLLEMRSKTDRLPLTRIRGVSFLFLVWLL